MSSFAPGRRKRAFLALLESELARAPRVGQVDPERVRGLAADQEVDLAREVYRPRCDLYRRFLEHCLADWALSEEETEDLEHLRRLLCIDAATAQAIHDDVSASIYGRAVDQVLEDYRLDDEERAFLARLRGDIGIGGASADALEREGKDRARRRFLERSVVHGSGIVASQQTEIEFHGASQQSFEAAVAAALGVAAEAVQGVRRAELKRVTVELEADEIARWDVTLKAIVEP